MEESLCRFCLDSTKAHNNKRYHSFTPLLVKQEDTRKGLEQLTVLEKRHPTLPVESSSIKCLALFVKMKPHWHLGPAGLVSVMGKHNLWAHCLSKSSLQSLSFPQPSTARCPSKSSDLHVAPFRLFVLPRPVSSEYFQSLNPHLHPIPEFWNNSIH